MNSDSRQGISITEKGNSVWESRKRRLRSGRYAEGTTRSRGRREKAHLDGAGKESGI